MTSHSQARPIAAVSWLLMATAVFANRIQIDLPSIPGVELENVQSPGARERTWPEQLIAFTPTLLWLSGLLLQVGLAFLHGIARIYGGAKDEAQMSTAGGDSD